MSERIEVKVGQIWRDNDKRINYTRCLRVDAIEGDKAICMEVHSSISGYFAMRGVRPRKILLRRFRPTSSGYVLVEDVA